MNYGDDYMWDLNKPSRVVLNVAMWNPETRQLVTFESIDEATAAFRAARKATMFNLSERYPDPADRKALIEWLDQRAANYPTLRRFKNV